MKGKKPRIYTIGPFRASTEFGRRQNIARAEDCALEIAKLGALIRCPHTHTAHFDGQLNDNYWIELGLDMLSECDAAMLVGDAQYLDPNSEMASFGSIIEVKFCNEHNIVVLRSFSEVEKYVQEWRNKHDQ